MKKILFVTFCFGCLSFAGLQAQKGNGKPTSETAEQGGGSTAKAKGVGKGSPLLQRNGATPAASESESKPVETMEQPSPAPAGKATLAPASPSPALENSANPPKSEAVVSPKPSNTGVSTRPKAVEAPKN